MSRPQRRGAEDEHSRHAGTDASSLLDVASAHHVGATLRVIDFETLRHIVAGDTEDLYILTR
jgi:hypothetical protein